MFGIHTHWSQEANLLRVDVESFPINLGNGKMALRYANHLSPFPLLGRKFTEKLDCRETVTVEFAYKRYEILIDLRIAGALLLCGTHASFLLIHATVALE
ncbi:MAG: hypothetical protein WC750_05280 [Patescibacteria group bacterium]